MAEKQPSVSKNQLAQMLADQLEISKKQATEYLETFTDTVTKLMKQGNKVNISGFGIFKVANRAARMGRNPATGETIQIKASKKAKFTPSKALKEAVL
jgi:DNA-binding protein HU-beta